MSRGLETEDVVEPWLHGVLTGDPALTGMVGSWVINTATDQDAPPDVDRYLVFSFVSARDVHTVGGGRAQVDCIYQVKAVARGSNYDPAAQAFRRADQLLDLDRTVSTPAGDVTCRRQSLLKYAENEGGAQYRHVGGLYRVRVNSTT